MIKRYFFTYKELIEDAEGCWIDYDDHLEDKDAALREQRTQLLAILALAVEHIREWHNMRMRADDAKKAWDIYWNKSPEMALIRKTLEGDAFGPGKEHTND